MTTRSGLAWLLGLLLIAGCDDGGGGGGGGAGGGADAGAGGAGGDPGDGGAPDAAAAGGVVIDGLTAAVDARFDANGILHLRCATDADCLAAQGYFHASHRFIQMDIRRRFVRGRLGQMVGSVTLDTDKSSRLFFATRDGSPLEAKVLAATDPYTRAALDAYARGVNAWLADLRAGRNGAKLNDEYDFPLIDKTALTDWEPEDSAACILALVRNLTDDSAAELRMGRIFGGLDAAVADDLYGLTPASPAVVQQEVGATKARPAGTERLMAPRLRAASDLLARAAARQPERRDDSIGSNNWVLGPGRSTDGKALLANDPHLGLSNPSVWYLVSIDAGEGGLHTAGASFAGLPGVILGQNADIAWGATTTNFDMSDVYLETLSPDGEGVMFNGAAVPFVKVDQTFELSDGPDVTETFLYVPHHGPVIAIDREAGTAVTVKWTGHDLSTDLMFPLAMNRAKSVAEARQVIQDTVTSVGQNWVIIDREGDFAWFPYNHLPRRPWASAALPTWLPLPGDGGAEWMGFLDVDEIPQAHAPAAGYIATANNDMTGAVQDGDPTNDGLPMLQAFVAQGYRQEQIQARIEATPKHDAASMQAIQADVRALIGERTVPALLAALDGVALDAGATAVRDALAGWDFQCPTGLEGVDPMGDFSTDEPAARASAGCTAFHVLWPRLVRAAFNDDLFETQAPSDAALVRLLTRPESFAREGDYWDDQRTDAIETAPEQIAGALADASAWLTENLGADPDAWRWGRIHTVTLAADLFSAAGLPDYDHGPFANDGGMYTVDVANPGGRFQDRYSHASGASMRFVCHAGDTVACTIELPGGQRHFRDSPHYDDLLQKYLVNEPVAFPFTPSEVDAATVESVAVNPAP